MTIPLKKIPTSMSRESDFPSHYQNALASGISLSARAGQWTSKIPLDRRSNPLNVIF